MKTNELYCMLLFKTNNKQSLKKLLVKFENVFGKSVLISENIYWKDETLYKVELIQSINVKSSFELLNIMLYKCSLLSPSWYFTIPRDFNVETSSLSAICDSSILIPGLNWINIEIR